MRIKFFLTLLVFCLSVSFASAARADDGVDALKEPELVSELYTGQTTFTCNGHVFKIPSYFPYQKKWKEWKIKDVYLTASPENCTQKVLAISLGETTGFTFMAHDKNLYAQKEDIEKRTKKIPINNNVDGYFEPSTCGASCSDSLLYWFDKKGVYILYGMNNKQETIDELIKSAKSYINVKE